MPPQHEVHRQRVGRLASVAAVGVEHVHAAVAIQWMHEPREKSAVQVHRLLHVEPHHHLLAPLVVPVVSSIRQKLIAPPLAGHLVDHVRLAANHLVTTAPARYYSTRR